MREAIRGNQRQSETIRGIQRMQAFVSLERVTSSPPYWPQPTDAPHPRKATSTRPRRACASKEKTSRIMRISGNGWGLKKPVACASDAFAGMAGATKHDESLIHSTPARQWEYVRWMGSRSRTRCFASGTHFFTQSGASSGALKTVGEASRVIARASRRATGAKLAA